MYETEDLADSLRKFYCAIRKQPKKDGTLQEYGKSSYLNIRACLQRHLSSPPYNRKIDIKKDKEFQGSNQVLEGKLKIMKREGRDRTEHKKPITEEDLRKMYSSGTLGISNPESLQFKVFFEIALHFGRRGRENWRNMKKDSFEVKEDANGTEYVTIPFHELDKNHQDLDNKRQMMFAQPDKVSCPVRSFKLYLSKLHPELDTFLQKPNPFYKKQNQWYSKVPLGVNTIGSIMKRISEKAETTYKYTNHCIRSTTTTVLQRAGMPAKDIMAVTGHRNQASLATYTEEPTDKERKNMSTILANYGEKDNIGNAHENQIAIPTRQPAGTDVMIESIDDQENNINTQQNQLPIAMNQHANREMLTENFAIANNTQSITKSIFAGAYFAGPVTVNINFQPNTNN